eukprot:Mrub_03955.p1 GENE.Mrub_03955~~Mrub_03955.p1  ORF type:complete len:425 (+),score=36.29 Mrub_03955:54-1277(+)
MIQNMNLDLILNLDLSRNELWDIPNLESLINLEKFDLSRNYFQEIPENISKLNSLQKLKMTHNLLQGSNLNVIHLKTLKNFKTLDIRYNRYCDKLIYYERLKSDLNNLVEIKISILFYEGMQSKEGSYVGNSAADRDANLLRSQLEPLSTSVIQRRLIEDFGQEIVKSWDRAEAMDKLLNCYKEEGLAISEFNEFSNSNLNLIANRHIIQTEGKSVRIDLINEILISLKNWANSGLKSGSMRERPSIKASSYMILKSPQSILELDSNNKFEKSYAQFIKYEHIYTLAMRALNEIDSEFASNIDAIAVTHNFTGSPHIDKQNTGPFYGLSMGNFKDGTGGIRVECSSRVICNVNTKNRLGKVDGRYIHWVAPFQSDDNAECDRYSLIFYRTSGQIQSAGPAIFELPKY